MRPLTGEKRTGESRALPRGSSKRSSLKTSVARTIASMYREAGSNRSVLVVALNGRLVGFDAQTGERHFEHILGIGIVEILVEAERIFAIAPGRKLYAFSYPAGEPLWQSPLPTTFVSRPTLLREADRLYVSLGGELVCVNAEDGTVLWHDGMRGMGTGSAALGFPRSVRQADG